MRCLFFFLFFLVSASSPAQAAPENVQKEIDEVFSILEQNDYSEASVDYVLSELTTIDHPAGLAATMIILQHERPSTPAVKALLEDLGARAIPFARAFPKQPAMDVDKYVRLYDGSTASLADALFWLHGRERGAYLDWDSQNGPSFEISCSFFQRHPDIGQFTKFVGWYQHRFASPSFPINCENLQSTYPNIFKYWKLAGEITYEHGYGCGTIYKDHAAGRRASLNQIFYRPGEFAKFNANNKSIIPNVRNSSFFDWAIVGRANYRTFLKLETLYEAALKDMTNYYVEQFGYSKKQAKDIAPFALSTQSHGGNNGGSFSRAMKASLDEQRTIRRILLEGQSPTTEAITTHKKLFGDSNPLNRPDFEAHKVSSAGIPEPVIHLAIDNTDTLRIFKDAGYDIEVRDALGKTALMVAAQEDHLDTIKFLLNNGADINAASANPAEIPGNNPIPGPRSHSCTPYNVSHGERTALMYAVSEASEELVSFLIENGADINASDSAGYSVKSYLVGSGPVPENPRLSADFRDRLLAIFEEHK